MFMSEATKKLEDYRAEAFVRLGDLANLSVDGIQLADAEAQLRQIKDLTVELSGKKSRIAEFKKEIGRVEPESRAEFAQAVQVLEKDIRTALESGEMLLSGRIQALKEEQETLDVTIPGRRLREGHLHVLTILRQKIEDNPRHPQFIQTVHGLGYKFTG